MHVLELCVHASVRDTCTCEPHGCKIVSLCLAAYWRGGGGDPWPLPWDTTYLVGLSSLSKSIETPRGKFNLTDPDNYIQ